MMPGNEYVEVRNAAYYVAGTRIGLDVIAGEFRLGRSAESIFDAYPSIGSLGKVYGALAFILDHPEAMANYFQDAGSRSGSNRHAFRTVPAGQHSFWSFPTRGGGTCYVGEGKTSR